MGETTSLGKIWGRPEVLGEIHNICQSQVVVPPPRPDVWNQAENLRKPGVCARAEVGTVCSEDATEGNPDVHSCLLHTSALTSRI